MAPKPLVIVESPAKARTIAGFLGDDFLVESSVGHIRDLPRSAKEIPEAYKKEKWSRDGVDVENDFEPTYEIMPADYGGTILSTLIFSYLVHLWIMPHDDSWPEEGDQPHEPPGA